MVKESFDTDVVIIGAGPVGLFAIFQCGMLKIRCHVVEALDFLGGQCTALYPEKPIYDIPAHPEISGYDLIENLIKQAEPFNPTYHMRQQAQGVKKTESGWEVTTSAGVTINTKAIIIAAGCGAFGPNRPPIKGLEEYEKTGSIVYLVRKKEDFRDKRVVIAGGGDSAVDWAISLADIASHIYIIHRRAKFRCAPESSDRMKKLAEDGIIDLVIPYQLDSLKGEGGKLKAVVVKNLDGEEKELQADVLIPFYGLSMELGPIADWELELKQKHLAVDFSTCATNQEGIFAVGDINNYKGKLKLITCGFAEAAIAAHAIYPLVYPNDAMHFEYSTTKKIPIG